MNEAHDPKFASLLHTSQGIAGFIKKLGLTEDPYNVQLIRKMVELQVVSRSAMNRSSGFTSWEAMGQGDRMAIRTDMFWKVMWAMCGYPSVVVRPKRAAYFAATQIRQECAEMFEAPWPAFYVSLPNCPWTTQVGSERKRYTGLSCYVQRAMADDMVVIDGDAKEGDQVWSWIAHTEAPEVTVFRAMYSYNWDSAKVNPWTWSITESSLPPDEEDVRMSQVLCQFVAGLALEFQFVNKSRGEAQARAHTKSNRDRVKQFATKLPRGSLYVLGDDVVVDARPAVADYIAGNGTSPTVRNFVRPHPKMQAHGPGWSQHKLIRIEGYWKGLENAPVSIRTHRWSTDT